MTEKQVGQVWEDEHGDQWTITEVRECVWTARCKELPFLGYESLANPGKWKLVKE